MCVHGALRCNTTEQVNGRDLVLHDDVGANISMKCEIGLRLYFPYFDPLVIFQHMKYDHLGSVKYLININNFQLIKYWGKDGQKVEKNNKMNDTADQVHVFQGNKLM